MYFFFLIVGVFKSSDVGAMMCRVFLSLLNPVATMFHVFTLCLCSDRTRLNSELKSTLKCTLSLGVDFLVWNYLAGDQVCYCEDFRAAGLETAFRFHKNLHKVRT